MNHHKYYLILIPLLSIVVCYAQHEHKQTMHGFYGRYPMSREASGTSWQPDSSPLLGIHKEHHAWQMMGYFFANGVFDHQGGRRGGTKVFSENMGMFMASRDYDRVTFAIRSMLSLEPITIGKKGYPLLLQNGETANGRTPLIDRQHPHDLFMELALVGTFKIDDKQSLYMYGAFPGEPALGPVVFMERFSGMYNPEAPITHHWLDSTHISFGVVTMGYIYDGIKIEGSVFNGREPDQHRFDFERPTLDSVAVRATYNPAENWSMQLSYGHLTSPEQLEPNVNTNRTTASITYNKTFNETTNWQTLFAWGHNRNKPGHALNGILLESTVEFKKHMVLGRYEWVEKDELFLKGSPFFNQIFNVQKIDASYLYSFITLHHLQFRAGVLGSFSMVPAKIKSVYSGTPFSYMLFVRMDLI